MSIEQLELLAKQHMKKDNGSAHGWDHVKRVRQIATHIAKTEDNVNFEVLLAMIFLHDVVRHEGEKEKQSVEDSIALSKTILQDLGYSNKFISSVVNGIGSHSIHSSKTIKQPQSIEAKILYDADKLDQLGLIGAARWLMIMSQKNKSIEYASKSFLDVLDTELERLNHSLHTKAGTALLMERASTARAFFVQLLNEISKG